MDISALKIVSASREGADMPLLNPFDGSETGAVFQVMGFDAPEIVAALRAFDRDEAKRPDRAEPDDVLARRRVAVCSAAVIGWTGFEFDGPQEYNSDLCREIMSNPEFAWIVDQVHRFGGHRRNFMPRPKDAASSGPSTSDTSKPQGSRTATDRAA